MNFLEIIVIVETVGILIILGLNWKDIFSILQPFRFYHVRLYKKSGEIKHILHLKSRDNSVFEHEKKEYYFLPTDKTFLGMKAYEFEQGNPYPLDKKGNFINRNLDFERERKEISYLKLLTEEKPLLQGYLEMIVPFIIGLVMGILIQMVQSGSLNSGAT